MGNLAEVSIALSLFTPGLTFYSEPQNKKQKIPADGP